MADAERHPEPRPYVLPASIEGTVDELDALTTSISLIAESGIVRDDAGLALSYLAAQAVSKVRAFRQLINDAPHG